MANLEDIITKVESLTVVELAELVHKLEEKFGISAAAPMAAGGGAGAAVADWVCVGGFQRACECVVSGSAVAIA